MSNVVSSNERDVGISRLELSERQPGDARVSFSGPLTFEQFIILIHSGLEFTLHRLLLETVSILERSARLNETGLRLFIEPWHLEEADAAQREAAARWIIRSARELNAATPTIDAAIGLRVLSAEEKANDFATTLFRQPVGRLPEEPNRIFQEMNGALNTAMIVTYAQAIALLSVGSERYDAAVDLTEVLRAWADCGGIRAALLEEMAAAVRSTPNLPNLLCDDDLSEKIMGQQEYLRQALWRANQLKIPVPTLTACLDYLDSSRDAWLPISLMDFH